MPPTGFEQAILVGDRPQTHALDHSASGIGNSKSTEKIGRKPLPWTARLMGSAGFAPRTVQPVPNCYTD
jgi:hypothetical protein